MNEWQELYALTWQNIRHDGICPESVIDPDEVADVVTDDVMQHRMRHLRLQLRRPLQQRLDLGAAT
jgi:hypothetical protein